MIVEQCGTVVITHMATVSPEIIFILRSINNVTFTNERAALA